MEYEIYHETLSATLENAISYIKSKATIQDEESLRERFVFDGISYGQTKSASALLSTYKGKPTRKGAHLSIYRMDSGRYELTVYFL